MRRIVLIADRVISHTASSDPNTLEMVENDYFSSILEALKTLSYNVVTYDSPAAFLDSIYKHKADIVVSLWSGINSKSRRALVPSICEAYDIAYLGADTYTAILSQDKYLSKRFARRFGLKASPDVLVSSEKDLHLIESLAPPLVVKPNFEGGSIGIQADSLARSHESACAEAKVLLETFGQAVLVEEFIEGQEASVVILGTKNEIRFLELVSLSLEGTDLRSSILSAEVKKISGCRKLHRLLPLSSLADDRATFEEIFFALGKVDALRIDGRIREGRFLLIELTPDIHFGPTATFAEAFALRKIGYRDMLAMALEVAQETSAG